MSNSGDYEILYWDVAGGCKLLRNRFESRDREWASYTCVLGFHVFGVWPDGSDGTDINSLCRSHHERVVAVADDFCKVHLFQYPCAGSKAPSHVYGGHGQPRHQRSLHPRRRAPRVPGGQRHQRLPVAGAGGGPPRTPPRRHPPPAPQNLGGTRAEPPPPPPPPFASSSAGPKLGGGGARSGVAPPPRFHAAL
ncbi:echinoderm microtubule-associated protein-like 3 [Strix uralensis]|uniref:echinoderm microtubule-associated protein-like 3 n=1 Tax=Strix uralensis TaxID=36305 RepID=UPI003DA245A6